MTDVTHWAELEFAELDLGDKRRESRARKIVEDFATRPSASIPKACNGWDETKATYRFLENDAIEWRDIMSPHWAMTEKRMAEHPVVLCLQDTTELNFNGKKSTGLGPLSYESQRECTCIPPTQSHQNGCRSAWWMPGCGRENRSIRMANAPESRKVSVGLKAMTG